ncbi:MAG TPA: hypothetical protein VF210_12625 [Pseudomonadales bacterium]
MDRSVRRAAVLALWALFAVGAACGREGSEGFAAGGRSHSEAARSHSEAARSHGEAARSHGEAACPDNEAPRAPGEVVHDPAGIEALLNATAEWLDATVAEPGRGFSYYSYGTRELLYAVGDLDGDGRPEIAARVIYFLGVGSYDLVDVFADRGCGYQRVDFLNLYHLGLEDEVESLAIRDGLLHIATVGFERAGRIRKSGAFRWPGPERV